MRVDSFAHAPLAAALCSVEKHSLTALMEWLRGKLRFVQCPSFKVHYIACMPKPRFPHNTHAAVCPACDSILEVCFVSPES